MVFFYVGKEPLGIFFNLRIYGYMLFVGSNFLSARISGRGALQTPKNIFA
jgi:hypothetical protein